MLINLKIPLNVEVKQGYVLQNLQESLSSWHSDLGWKE